jgi:hypothetical protein
MERNCEFCKGEADLACYYEEHEYFGWPGGVVLACEDCWTMAECYPAYDYIRRIEDLKTGKVRWEKDSEFPNCIEVTRHSENRVSLKLLPRAFEDGSGLRVLAEFEGEGFKIIDQSFWFLEEGRRVEEIELRRWPKRKK